MMKILMSALLIAILLFSCKHTVERLMDFENLREDIYKRYPKIEATDQENYISDCKEDDRKKLRFPMGKSSYALLFKNDLLKKPIKLSSESMNLLIKMLNDSTNYIWGEIGTPEFDNHIVFYDNNNICIGLAHVSYDGQICIDPYLKKMKWGMVKDPVMNMVKSISK